MKVSDTRHFTRAKFGAPTRCECGTKKYPWTKVTRKRALVTCKRCISLMGKVAPVSDKELLQEYRAFYQRYERTAWHPREEIPVDVVKWIAMTPLLLAWCGKLLRECERYRR
jgi:hypothetical protein